MATIFISHSRRDNDLAPWFDRVFARENVEALQFEFEFEALRENPTDNLTQLLRASSALFVLNTPEIARTGTLHTGNWISAEVGMARALGKPIWVFERVSNHAEFPVPYVDHYVRLSTNNDDMSFFQLVRTIIQQYSGSRPPPKLWSGASHLFCSKNPSCQTFFQIHQSNRDFDRCPACCTRDAWDMATLICPACGGKGGGCNYCLDRGSFFVDMSSDPCSGCDGQGVVYLDTISTRTPRRVTRATPRQAPCQWCKGTRYQRWENTPAE